MEALKGVAYTFKVINEDATGVTKTWANSRLQGPDAVLTMLKFLQRKLAGNTVNFNNQDRRTRIANNSLEHMSFICHIKISVTSLHRNLVTRKKNQTSEDISVWAGPPADREAGSCY